jgi:hypothetical protein
VGTFLLRLLLVYPFLLGSAGAALAQAEEFGTAHFAISCSGNAQDRFDRAITKLHTFFFPDTAREFTALAEAEPSCAMAYWGIAISQRPNPLAGPFADDVLQRGQEAITKARAAEQQTQREHDWIAALAEFYNDYRSVSQAERTKNYEAAMSRLHERYPEDPEAAIFYALALNEAAEPNDRTYARQLKAAAILQDLQSQYPNHPGIWHYLIHSYDYPELAPMGLFAAARCAQVARSSPHALHMPSHIFAMLGMWNDVVAADRAAVASMADYIKRTNKGASYDTTAANPAQYHSFDFLTNAYLQLAQDNKAKEIVAIRDKLSTFPADYRSTGHMAFAAIPVRYAFERGAWAEAAALSVPRTPFAQVEAVTWFGRGIGGARSGDLATARLARQHLSTLRQRLTQANDSYWAGQVAIQETATEAWIDLAEGRKASAIARMRRAADLEDQSGKHIAMENRLSPMRELLGEMLLEARESAQALKEFAMALRAYPNRFRSIAGAAKAADLLGDEATAKRYYGLLLELADKADADRPALLHARQVAKRDGR